MELRMYGLVNYQLMGIQKGIQFLHGVVEYGQKYKDTELYNEWANDHKTVILLNGGTTNKKTTVSRHELWENEDDGLPLGSLNQHALTLDKSGIDFAIFHEPDLGDQLTAVVFIVDERVFNRKDYPNFKDWLEEKIISSPVGDLSKDENLIKHYNKNSYLEKLINFKEFVEIEKKNGNDHYFEWTEFLGGKKNVFLRDFLKNFRLA